MSIDKESDPAACFLGLSQRLSDIFKLTSHRLSLISKSLSASIDSQLALPSQLNLPEPPSLNPKDRPGHSANTQTVLTANVRPLRNPLTTRHPASRTAFRRSGTLARDRVRCLLKIGRTTRPSDRFHLTCWAKKRKSDTTPNAIDTTKDSKRRCRSHRLPDVISAERHTHAPLPRRHSTSLLLEIMTRYSRSNHVPLTKSDRGKPLSMNLLERIASPPAPVGAGSDPASPPLVQSVDSRYSPSPQSSPMDMRESDLSKEVSPRAERRVSSPVSSSRRADDSSYNQSSRTRSSYSRRSRSPSSRSSDWRYRRASLRSPSRRESIAHQPSRRPYTYDSYHPTQSSSRTYRPRSRSPSRSRRERSNSTRVSPSRFLDRIDTRETRFLDRIESRQDRDFAEYLEKDRGDPSYERLILILRRLHGSNFARSIISLDLWEEFHRFRNRTDTREERMLRHLHIYPELMHRYLCCACERKVITYWPDHKSLKSSTIKLDISHRPAAR
ncbi:hypothetical protein PSHT_09546 [Puccinia striiformis]|uniref:Uncharacterized protein n=1 Tax=Puccinia striiformis TaxID=27350 RepID=A0A2S4VG33_9BASI|nr:hypothetical protein PSHT_09546 [Puccinia striiformis]